MSAIKVSEVTTGTLKRIWQWCGIRMDCPAPPPPLTIFGAAAIPSLKELILFRHQYSWANIFRRLFSKRWTFGSKGALLGQKAALNRTKDLVPLFDPKVNLFETSLPKMLAQLQYASFILATHILPLFSAPRGARGSPSNPS